MSLKALALARLPRTGPCNSPFNTAERDAILRATLAITGSTAERAERAAIVQEGAKVPREWAEGFARLEARPIPRGVEAVAWLAMMNAAGRFLDQWGGKASALGWTAGELFGLDPHSPMCRRDRRGAGFYLADCEVIAITAAEITVRKGGSMLRIPRRGGFTAPAWEPSAAPHFKSEI